MSKSLVNIVKIIRTLFSPGWYKGMMVRTALLLWLVIVLTLLIFIIGTLPYQKKIIEERMRSEANDIAGSIGQVTATAIINNDYGFTVEHCLKIINQSKSILYIIITRNDGFSLVHRVNGWRADTLRDKQNLPGVSTPVSDIIFSKMENQEVFHFSAPFNYSGIDWGRINVGLSLEEYNANIKYLYIRTIWLTLFSIIAGLIISIIFAKKVTYPIRQLDNVAQQVAGGDLKVRVNINSEDEIGRLARTFNQMTDSLQSAQSNLENKVEERTAELEKMNQVLQAALSEKEVLLKEIHHRVKNNLQIISSLLYLSSMKIKDEQALNMFVDSQNRVKSIALVHERLYQSKNLGKIDFKEYVEKLSHDLFSSYILNKTEINLVIKVENVIIDIDKAVPCGLIINELITNSFKYAFPRERDIKGEIIICFTNNDNHEYVLSVSDNGIGLPGEKIDKKRDSLGLKLVETLVKQLDGKLIIKTNPGTVFQIKFKA